MLLMIQPLILDDTLVNCDEDRTPELLKILYQAQKNLQVILLSCYRQHLSELGEERRINFYKKK